MTVHSTIVDDLPAGPKWLRACVVPSRAAYLIRAGSRAGFRRAVQEASSRWGGATEPIIPVRRDGEVDGWWRQVAEVSNIDGLVNVDAGDEASVFANSLQLPLVSIDHIDAEGATKWNLHPNALPDNRRDTTQAPILASDSLPLWEVAAAGDMSVDQLSELREDLVPVRRARTADEVARAALHRQTWLDRGLASFGEHQGRGTLYPLPAILWVTKENTLLDAIWFWNFRALRSLRISPAPMMLLPHDKVQDWINFDRDLRSLLARPDEFSPDVVINSMSVHPDELRKMAAMLNLHESTTKTRFSHKWPAETRKPPFTYKINLNLKSLLIFEREYGEVVDIEIHPANRRATLRFSSPVPFSRQGRALLRLHGDVFDGLPRRQVVAEAIYPNATWHNDQLQIASTVSARYKLEIQLPTYEDATHAVLKKATARYELSDKGRIASTFLSSGIIDPLLSSGIHEAITSLKTPRSKSMLRDIRKLRAEGANDDAMYELAARWGGRVERRYRSAFDLREQLGDNAAVPLEELCSLGWAERGVETNCPRCGMPSFVPLRTVNGPAECPGCHAKAPYTASSGAVDIQYRLDSYVDRASDQGVIPHLLVIAGLQRLSSQTYLLGGINVEFADGHTGECDVVGIHKGRLIAGEVKTKSSDFTVRQIDHDVDISRRLGADDHLLASIDSIPTPTVESVRTAAAAAGLELVVITLDDMR